MPLHLLRHATAGHRRPGDDADHLRPLDERGRLQAAALPEQYAHFGIERILTSPFVRCRQSVEPLADALRLPVEERAKLAEGTTEAAPATSSARARVAASVVPSASSARSSTGRRSASASGSTD